jgi:ABC-type Na+ efflux pump permease subunit
MLGMTVKLAITGAITMALMQTVTVYANNTYGFTGASETVTFTIATFPTTLVAASIILAAIIGAGLLVYFKKQGSKKILK